MNAQTASEEMAPAAAASVANDAYRSFPTVAQWIAGAPLVADRVDRLKPLIERFEQLPPDACRRAISVVKDAAVIETGAIEDLYELDRGITITAATEGAFLDSSVLGSQPEKVRALIEAQLRAYDFVLDFVTEKQSLAEAWIRALHEQLCAAQTHYRVRTTAGDEQRPLERGRYKSEPNHVLTSSGRTHMYAPVNDTPMEMQRLVDALRSDEFSSLHPIDQAAYAHCAFVTIHPFADGNGRMARALASVYTYREYRVPLLITVDQKPRYFAALEDADGGDYLPFRNFIRERIVDSILLLTDSVRAAQTGSPAESIARIRNLFLTKGKYSHVEVDQAGARLLVKLLSEIKKIIESGDLKLSGLNLSVSYNNSSRELGNKNYRRPIGASAQLVKLRAQTNSPAEGVTDVDIGVGVPKDADEMDEFLLECGPNSALECSIPVRNVLPEQTLMADMALVIFAGRVVSDTIKNLEKIARQSLKKKGY
ncbi:MAG TPA: Fic family protein [Steroidobacteraceae bacterium]|nr:Fic family protein [Steroidobacteraceae bacterium]